MGFAGQVFAARVAVGLAMPSPKAFSQAGALIGGFASNMYKRLNKDNVTAGQQQLKSAQENLGKARDALAKHSANQNDFMEKSASEAISKMKGAYKGLGKAAMESAGAMGKMRKSSALSQGTKVKLFANVSKDMKSAKDYEQMMKNFTKLKKEQRREVILGFDAEITALQGTIRTTKQKEKLGEEGVQIIKDEIAVLQQQRSEFNEFHKHRINSDEKYQREHKELTDNVKKGENEVAQARQKANLIMEGQIRVQERMHAGIQNVAFEIKSNFVEAIRESISVLTAFYYKLNQNTQELISFERELLNANSVFRVTNDELFDVGNQVVQFGQEFGMEMQNGATGLYQLASAGLSAADSMQVLNDTLKLSMAVQGDHNTISKLVTQTLFGFDMQMSEATEVTDKFAFAIQKSLIEYQDLASAVKFALPFFTTTGQSIDQLLGALQILTNRALEAGIAGRGLRQGVAELAESIGDASANFKQFGVEVTDNQGNMLQLTEIAANFHKVLDEGVINDTELLTTLIQDLNVRGATAFVHLVQASDEFTQAVIDTKNAGGELDEMVRIQNQSIGAQLQILANNIDMMFMFRDANYEGTRFLNAFHEAVVETVESLRDLLVVQEGNNFVLTEFGLTLQQMAINGVRELQKLLNNIIPIMKDFVSVIALGFKLFQIYLIPIRMVIKALEVMGPTITKVVIAMHLLTKILPITRMMTLAAGVATLYYNKVKAEKILIEMADKAATDSYIASGIAYLFLQKATEIQTYKNIASMIYENTIGRITLFRKQEEVVYDQIRLRLTLKGIVIRAQEIAQQIYQNILTFYYQTLTKQNIILMGTEAAQKLINLILDIKYNIQKGIMIVRNTILNAIAVVALALGKEEVVMRTVNKKLIGFEIFMKAAKMAQDLNALVVAKITVAWQKKGLFWKKATTLQTYKDIIAKVIETTVTIAYNIVTFIAAAATMAFNAALYLNPIGLVVIGIVAAVAIIVIFAIKINEQIGLWEMFTLGVKHFFGMIMWGANIFIGLFKNIGNAVYDIIEGPLFKLGLFFGHLFKMLAYYARYIGGLLMDKLVTPLIEGFAMFGGFIKDKVIDPIFSLFSGIKGLIEEMKNPLFIIGQYIKDYVIGPISNTIGRLRSAVATIVNAVREIAGLNPLANGGYVQPMANGGSAGRKPYLVGEVGPEIFIPQSAGKIIPNKDLNTKRVHNMLQAAFESDSDVDRAAGLIQANTIQVSNLQVKEARLGKSRIGIDSFAGGI